MIAPRDADICDACSRNGIWALRRACSCELPADWAAWNGTLYACTRHLHTVIRILTDGHRPHVGMRSSEVVVFEVPSRA
jgi:hypothetical protein